MAASFVFVFYERARAPSSLFHLGAVFLVNNFVYSVAKTKARQFAIAILKLISLRNCVCTLCTISIGVIFPEKKEREWNVHLRIVPCMQYNVNEWKNCHGCHESSDAKAIANLLFKILIATSLRHTKYTKKMNNNNKNCNFRSQSMYNATSIK